jgi:hypothetical protein
VLNIGPIDPPPCPECGAPMEERSKKPQKWACDAHGWLARGFLAKQVISKRERFTFEAGEVGTSFRHKPIRTNPNLRYLLYRLAES